MVLLDIKNVSVSYGQHIANPAIRGVNLTINAGERVGIVGESGSGKSTLAAAILRSLPKKAGLSSGTIHFNGDDLESLSDREFQAIRSVRISRIPQDPLASLNPVFRVGKQLNDVIRAHRSLSRSERDRLVVEALDSVGIPDARAKSRAYPHELSGGMRQRVLIAMSLINSPELLIADEPTTALDVTVQAQIIDLLQSRLTRDHMTMLLITHDIGVVSELCNRIVVMQGGTIVEEGETVEIMRHPKHPYTQSLFAAASADPLRDRIEASV